MLSMSRTERRSIWLEYDARSVKARPCTTSQAMVRSLDCTMKAVGGYDKDHQSSPNIHSLLLSGSSLYKMRRYFPATLAIGCRQVTKFWLTRCKKWYLQLLRSDLNGEKNVPASSFPPLYWLEQEHEGWIRMAGSVCIPHIMRLSIAALDYKHVLC